MVAAAREMKRSDAFRLSVDLDLADELRQQPQARLITGAVLLSLGKHHVDHLGPVVRNVSVGRIELSREMTVPDFPVRLKVSIHNESNAEAQIPLRLLLDGQPLAGKLQSPTVPAHGESVVEFDHALRADGTHILSVEANMSDDAIAVDNISHAAIHVAKSLEVLLVNGTPSAQPAERDSFFAELAFAPPEGKPPWVKAKVVEAADLRPEDFQSVSAAILCNVGRISPEVAFALKDFNHLHQML